MVIEGLSSAHAAAREKVIADAARDLKAWLANPEVVGAQWLARMERRVNKVLPIESSHRALKSEHDNGLKVADINISDNQASWYDWYGEPLRLVASLIAQKVGYPIEIVKVSGGNGHDAATWRRVEVDCDLSCPRSRTDDP